MAAEITHKFNSIQEYLSSLPAGKRKVLNELRKTIKKIIPSAEEVISYNIPAFKLKKIIVYYSAWKDHISLYPRSAEMDKAFKKELDPYKSGKGTLQFALDEPIPESLIERIVEFRLKQMQETGGEGKSKK